MATEEKRPALTERGIVQRGRTVLVPHPTETKIIGFHPITSEPIRGPVLMEFGPAAEVTLPIAEMARLRQSGFIVDPNKVVPAAAEHSNG